MSQPLDGHIAADTLQSELPCVDCGYLLRGLSAAGACPECGASIARSMRGDALWFANPRWIAKLRLAVVVMLLVYVMRPGMRLFIWIASLIGWNDIGYRYERAWALSILGVGGWLCGSLLLAQREPRHVNTQPGWDLNRWIVITAIASAALMAIGYVSGFFLAPTTLGLIWLPYLVVYMVRDICVILLLQRLARRLHAPPLVRMTKLLLILVIVGEVINYLPLSAGLLGGSIMAFYRFSTWVITGVRMIMIGVLIAFWVQLHGALHHARRIHLAEGWRPKQVKNRPAGVGGHRTGREGGEFADALL